MAKQPTPPLDRIFHAIADPTRLKVVEALARGPASVSELAQPFDIALPTFLKHLKVLEDGGWIVTRKSGRVRACALSPQGFQAAQTWVARHRALWEGRADRLAELLDTLQTKETRQ